MEPDDVLVLIDKLKKGIYSIEITLPEYPNYKASFSVEISEPEALVVAAKQDNIKKSVTLNLSGSESYFITINGIVSKTNLTKIKLPLNKEINKISVSTNKACQGIFEQTIILENEVKISQNPVEDTFTLTTPTNLTNSVLNIYNTIGTLVQQENISKTISTIKVNQLPQGVYIIKVEKQGEITAHSKFIIK